MCYVLVQQNATRQNVLGVHGQTVTGQNVLGVHGQSVTGQNVLGVHGQSVTGQNVLGVHGQSVTGQNVRVQSVTKKISPDKMSPCVREYVLPCTLLPIFF